MRTTLRSLSSGSADARVLARLQSQLPRLYSHTFEQFEPVWRAATTAVVADAPAVVVDLASGLGEPACSLARRFPHAEIVASEAEEGMLALCRERVAAKGLAHRVGVHQIDLLDLHALAAPGAETLQCDVVTCSLALYMVAPAAQGPCLDGIKALLRPKGQLVATVWDRFPLFDLGERCLAAATRGTALADSAPAGLPFSPTSLGNGHADALLASAGLRPGPRHNERGSMRLSLGALDDDETWMRALLPFMGALAEAAQSPQADGRVFERARAAFDAEAAALDFLTPHGPYSKEHVELDLEFRLISVLKP